MVLFGGSSVKMIERQQNSISSAQEVGFFSRSLLASGIFVFNLVLACAVVVACAVIVFKFWSRFRNPVAASFLLPELVTINLILTFVSHFREHARIRELDLKGITSETVPVRTLLTVLRATENIMVRDLLYLLLSILLLVGQIYIFRFSCPLNVETHRRHFFFTTGRIAHPSRVLRGASRLL